MSVASLLNVPGSDTEFNQWSFAHADHHRNCIQATLTQKNVTLAEFPLDPINLGEGLESWVYQHQQMHDAQNMALGVNGFDLTAANWQDANELAAWIQDNENEHYQWATILGVW